MSKLEHTPGPWTADSNRRTIYTKAANIKGNVICVEPDDGMEESQKNWNANRARIVACVNACAGVKNPEPLHKVIQCLKYIQAKWYVPAPNTTGGDSILITFPSKLERAKFVAGIEALLTKLETEPKDG